ncbi:MAG: hypothetical protein J6Y03_01955 [Alphaproteobacteria bacterium]|nr:hypothetical protein [Alphaproteobacteria bacterium]
MTRKNIFEILESKYNPTNELFKIATLFGDKSIIHTFTMLLGKEVTNRYSIEEKVNDIFSSWKSRGTCISCEDMRNELGINEIFKKFGKIPTDDIICCLEYYKNIYFLFVNRVKPVLQNYKYTNSFHMLNSNMDTLLDHLNYDQYCFKDQEKVILVPKNPAATAVAEISSEDTAMAILKYHHASLKGQIEEKRDLLRRIAKEYEPILDNGVNGFNDYFKRANDLLNNLDIRHNNKVGKKKNELVTNLTNEELEKWYDELYQLLLFCVLIKDNKERKERIEEFLNTKRKDAK